MNNNYNDYPITMLCKVLNLPRSTYYEALVHEPSNKEKEYKSFSDHVMSTYYDSKGRYGAPKICFLLNKAGVKCSVKRVQRHMKKIGIKSITVKKYRPQKNAAPVPDDKINILNQDFKASAPNQKLVTDITYIHTLKDGWTYLASVIDLYHHKVIGYSYSKSMTAEMATQAVRNAVLNIDKTEGIILHSDLGAQYTSIQFEDFLVEQKILHSFSRKGNPYDNACIESFHAALKKEEVYTKIYYDFEEAKYALFEYIESWYNRKRIHESLNYMTPQEKEDEFNRVA
ncbi:IS3 family transposase [Aequitasia blattaphilus]|uniref:IS3 family transposase n=1 Tax=Aequitasia blattaphilus TaxID=2949332 RepID=A0ABT1ED51_9FIRM|nr:IS3 family transposase [Aequitasia blattaphilus]MCP1103771.1 IS3 family transposase [Aequitasia blattaphilus]MCR8616411.1 IS3 family transposase [Aequitasia blattaphilus]